MTDFVAYNSPLRVALHLLISLGGVVGGLMLVGAFAGTVGPADSRDGLSAFIGIICILFCGYGCILTTRMFFDRQPQLVVGAAGIQFARWSSETVPWSEITDVALYEIKRHTPWPHTIARGIIVYLADPGKFPGKGLLGILQGPNRAMTCADIYISLSVTNRSVDEAMAVIESFRAKVQRHIDVR